MLKLQRPDVSYFRVFGCGAYVFLPEEVRQNIVAPKSELMTFISYADSVKGYLFMRSTNYIFTAVKVLFNENVYPRCPHMQRPDFIDIRPPTDNSDHTALLSVSQLWQHYQGPPLSAVWFILTTQVCLIFKIIKDLWSVLSYLSLFIEIQPVSGRLGFSTHTCLRLSPLQTRRV